MKEVKQRAHACATAPSPVPASATSMWASMRSMYTYAALRRLIGDELDNGKR
jgi:hypothetical protein